jgi:hypothetical protein
MFHWTDDVCSAVVALLLQEEQRSHDLATVNGRVKASASATEACDLVHS